MILSDLEFFLVEIPCDDRRPAVRSLLVRLATDSGREGWGETRIEWRASELPQRREVLLSLLTGRNVFEVEDLLDQQALRSPSLRSAVEMASWDLIGRITDQPLHRLFGGAYRSRIPLAVRLAGSTPEETARLAAELADQGFHTQIATSSGRVSGDLEMLAAVKQAVGDLVELRLDAAGCYDLEAARELCNQLEDDGPRFLLDPLRADRADDLRSLHRQVNVPLAVWRGVGSAADVFALARSRAVSFVVVDLQQVGGLASARKCAAVAEAADVHALISADSSLGIGTAAMLQLAASTPAFSSCNECVYHQLRDDILAEPLEVADGMITVPQGPGLGIEVDREKVERYQVA